MNRVQVKFVNDALDSPEKLTDWEYDFLNDLVERDHEGDYELSEKQNEILNRIQRKIDR